MAEECVITGLHPCSEPQKPLTPEEQEQVHDGRDHGSAEAAAQPHLGVDRFQAEHFLHAGNRL